MDTKPDAAAAAPAAASDTHGTPPAASRVACMHERDAFYACLDAHVADAAACAAAREAFTAACPRAWVRYWDDRRKRKLPMRHITGDELTRT